MLQPDIGMTSVVLLTFGFQLFLAGLPLLLSLLQLVLPFGRLARLFTFWTCAAAR